MATAYALDFEKPLARAGAADRGSASGSAKTADRCRRGDPARCEERLDAPAHEIYQQPDADAAGEGRPASPPALHARLPRTIFTDFIELHGDRLFRDDPAIVGGWARLDGASVMVIGHQKGRDTKENLQRNFGMAHPEGYRKALRLMQLAAKFERPGHHPDRHRRAPIPAWAPRSGASRRRWRATSSRWRRCPTPIVAVVIGEGGSGGALALGVADRILMLENSVYSVISPEGCAAILWKDAAPAGARRRGAQADRRRTCSRFKLIDEIIPEPVGGAHLDPDAAGEALRDALIRHVNELRKVRSGETGARAARTNTPQWAPTPSLMPQTVEVRFKGNRRDFYHWPDAAGPLRLNEAVVVELERGLDFGYVNTAGEVRWEMRRRCTACAVAGECAAERWW